MGNSPNERYDLRCPHCDATHTCSAKSLGKRVSCTKCGKGFQVPEILVTRRSAQPEPPPLIDWVPDDRRTDPSARGDSPFLREEPRRSQQIQGNTLTLNKVLVFAAVPVAVFVLLLLVYGIVVVVGGTDSGQSTYSTAVSGEIVQILFGFAFVLVAFVVSVAVYFLPTGVAILRKHRFTGVIFVLNLAGGWSVLGWFVALGWAVWPSETVFSDVLTHDPTGLSQRNVGHATGEIRNAYDEARRSLE